MSRSLRRAAIATAAVVGVAIATPGLAGATNVIPGDSDPGTKIITGHEGVTVDIESVDRETGVVSGTFVNESGLNLTCQSPNPNPNLNRGGTVTTADVALASRNYYTLYPEPDPASFNLGSNIIFVGNVGANADFWPLLQLVPTGSAAGFLSDSAAAAAEIGSAHRDAQVRGMVGHVDTFTVNNGQTHAWSTTLGQAATGARGTDPLGAVFNCRVGSNANADHFLWVGLEEVDEEEPSTGSLGSLTGGSSGSSGGQTPPAGEGDDGAEPGEGGEPGEDGTDPDTP